MRKKIHYDKGLSAIEILCVIIVLSVIATVAYLIILKISLKAGERFLNTAAESAAKWFDNQYELAANEVVSNSNLIDISKEFQNTCGTNGEKCLSDIDSIGIDASEAIKASGLKEKDIEKMLVIINISNKKSCVKLFLKETSRYYSENKQTVVAGNCQLNFIDEKDM